MQFFNLGRFIFHIQSRNICLSSISNKIVPNNLKGKSKSSQDWITRQLNDEYVIKSRYHGYRCRSAYKLLEIDDKYKILKPGYSVVDCGAAPGSWTQVVVQKLKLYQEPKGDKPLKGIAIAVDLQCMEAVKGAVTISESDFTLPSVQEKILNLLPNKKANVILSDMAPKSSGTYDLDTAAIMQLVYSALKFSLPILMEDGSFLCKVWDGDEVHKLFKTLEMFFSRVKRVKPKASRSDSAELYLLATGYKGMKQ